MSDEQTNPIDETLSEISKGMELNQVVRAGVATAIEASARIMISNLSPEEKTQAIRETIEDFSDVIVRYVKGDR